MTEQKKSEIIKMFASVGLSAERAEKASGELYNVLKGKGLTIEQADVLFDFMKDLIRMAVTIP